MFNFLLDTVSSDGVPDGIASGLDFHGEEFIFGIIVGAIITLTIIGIVKYAKFIIKDNQEMARNINSSRSDE